MANLSVYIALIMDRIEFDTGWKSVSSTSRLGSCQCCTLKIEILDCNEFGFFGQLLDVYRKIFLTSLMTTQNKAIRFFPLTPLQLWFDNFDGINFCRGTIIKSALCHDVYFHIKTYCILQTAR